MKTVVDHIKDEVDRQLDRIKDEVIESWARDANLSVNDPHFWEKYNKFVSEQPEPEYQTDYCPCCGQEIE